ncbi:hydrogenase maturation protease [Thioflavicoccus mobilis 8321]|uniref:Hydrogenase maturation protease n=1 Tax=Thioflavicoccus mobilis 8321 TaxID=765912 RepID=L0H0I0_9GAMM|nr:hydrogenase maturation protease [Thioflavicoccus mobilis]AGA91094.1 hydrogenase maturation protease [Thioflavicoccus mobilis 8321]
MATNPENSRPSRALVIGYGSPIRGDDAIGPLVAEHLERDGVPAGVTVLARHILTADLVPDICAADLVVFIDATPDGEPGEVHCRPLTPDPTSIAPMAHALDPRELLTWAAALYDHDPRAYLVSTPGHSFDFAHFGLSEPVAGAVEALAARVRELIAEPPGIDGQRVVSNAFGDGSITS